MARLNPALYVLWIENVDNDATSDVLLDEGPVFPVQDSQGFVVLEFAERPENVLEGKCFAEQVPCINSFLNENNTSPIKNCT